MFAVPASVDLALELRSGLAAVRADIASLAASLPPTQSTTFNLSQPPRPSPIEISSDFQATSLVSAALPTRHQLGPEPTVNCVGGVDRSNAGCVKRLGFSTSARASGVTLTARSTGSGVRSHHFSWLVQNAPQGFAGWVPRQQYNCLSSRSRDLAASSGARDMLLPSTQQPSVRLAVQQPGNTRANINHVPKCRAALEGGNQCPEVCSVATAGEITSLGAGAASSWPSPMRTTDIITKDLLEQQRDNCRRSSSCFCNGIDKVCCPTWTACESLHASSSMQPAFGISAGTVSFRQKKAMTESPVIRTGNKSPVGMHAKGAVEISTALDKSESGRVFSSSPAPSASGHSDLESSPRRSESFPAQSPPPPPPLPLQQRPGNKTGSHHLMPAAECAVS